MDMVEWSRAHRKGLRFSFGPLVSSIAGPKVMKVQSNASCIPNHQVSKLQSRPRMLDNTNKISENRRPTNVPTPNPPTQTVAAAVAL